MGEETFSVPGHMVVLVHRRRWGWLLAAPGWIEVGVPCLLDVLQARCPYGCLASLEKALEFAVRVTDILNVSIGGETSSVSTEETAV